MKTPQYSKNNMYQSLIFWENIGIFSWLGTLSSQTNDATLSELCSIDDL